MKPWTVRLKPEPRSSLYVLVRVWPTKKAMLAHLNQTHHRGNKRGKASRRTEGTCSTVYRIKVSKSGRSRRSPCVAEVNLHRGRLGIEVITHELFHATMGWAKRVKLALEQVDELSRGTELEERIAYVHGTMNRQFVDRGLRPGGCYKPSDLVEKR